jgi:O-succinylbenzoic acid--CoA ligase
MPEPLAGARPRTFPRWLAEATSRRGEHVAILGPGVSMTYRELEAAACRRAAQLLALGARAGGRVALLMHSSALTIELIHAAMMLPCTLLLLHPRLGARELAPLLAEARPDILVFGGEVWDAAEAAARAADTRAVSAEALLTTPHAQGFAPCKALPADLDHCILYTSGTTGTPKGARLSFRSQLASARASAARLGVSERDRWLLCMPLCHIGGLAVVLRSAIYATTVVFQRSFEPRAVAECLARDAITHVSLVPTMVARLLAECPSFTAPQTLRCVLVGGAALDRATHAAACARGLPIAATYGLTEAASQVATHTPATQLLAGGVPPLPGVELRIVGDDGRDVEPGTPGEILVRAPHVMSGYLDRPVETARAMRGGWLHTGDYGMLDARGCLGVLDRRGDLIVSGGENVYPAEIEAVLLAHPRVRDAAVVGLPDPAWGHAVTAVVVPADACVPSDAGAPSEAVVPSEAAVPSDGGFAGEPALAAELRAHCAASLAPFKRPKRIIVAGALPRTSTGKLQREQVRQSLAAQIEAAPVAR